MFALTLTASRKIKPAQLVKAISAFKLKSRQDIRFTGTTHSAFRQHIKRMGSVDIKSRGADTFLYNAKNQIIGKVTAASMNAKGKVTPVQYFIAAPKALNAFSNTVNLQSPANLQNPIAQTAFARA